MLGLVELVLPWKIRKGVCFWWNCATWDEIHETAVLCRLSAEEVCGLGSSASTIFIYFKIPTALISSRQQEASGREGVLA